MADVDTYKSVAQTKLGKMDKPYAWYAHNIRFREMDDYWSTVGKSIPDDNCDQYTSRRLVRERIGKKRGLKVLDLGCGDGRGAEFFLSLPNNIDYTGVDIESSPEVASRTRSDIAFDTFDGVNLPYEDRSFDIVFSHQVFEHVANPSGLLKSVRRVLKQEGEFIGSVSQLEPYHSLSLWNYTAYGWSKLLRSSGLQVVELRPGIDSLTLIYRSFSERKDRFSRFFHSESPLNAKIRRRSAGTIKQIANRKLLFCGHLIFCAKSMKIEEGSVACILNIEE